MWIVLALALATTEAARDQLTGGRPGRDQVVSAPDDSTRITTTTTPPDLVPAAGQVLVRGRITALRLDGAVLQPRAVPLPVTITSSRGFGNGGEVTGVRVDGQPSTIVWDGGRPFALSGSGALLLDPLSVNLSPQGLLLRLGGGAHALAPGSYRLDTPVAVGTSGMATPRDSVQFEAGPSSLFEARGDAVLVAGSDAPRRFVGPGAMRIEGDLQVTAADGTRSVVTVLDLAQGSFDLTVARDGTGGWSVTGVADEPSGP